MPPLNDKGRNEEVKDYNREQKEAHFLQKYKRTYESLQRGQRNVNIQHQRKRRLDDDTARQYTVETLKAGSKTAGIDIGSFPKPKPVYDGLLPKSKGPRPTSSAETAAKPAGYPPTGGILPAGSPPTGGTLRNVAAPAVRVPMSKTQAVPISAPVPTRASGPVGTFAAVALLPDDRLNNIGRTAVISHPTDGVQRGSLSSSVGQGMNNVRQLTDGMAYHPGPSASTPSPIVKAGDSPYLPVRLEVGIETRFGGPSAFSMNTVPEHKTILKWIKRAERNARERGSGRSRYSEVYLDDPTFAEAAFNAGLGPILHFASLDGNGLQAEDADDVWAKQKSRMESGESSKFGSNHVSRQGLRLTPPTSESSSSGLTNSGKGTSGKRKPDNRSGPGVQHGKGKKGKK